jgi:hypothetical protein
MERLPPEDDAEPFLIATIMQAMVEGRSLTVHAAVSRTLLSNLTEYRDAWHCWLPREYARIDFESDTITDPAPSDKRDQAVVAYSGGLDGAFSVWRHTQGHAGFRTQRIRCCAFVHGFDIPLSDVDAFAAVRRTSERTLLTLSLPLVAVRTNFRDIVTVNWLHVHGAALVSVLQHFREVCGTAIIGSSEPYNTPLAVPLGSNPITDPLLSSGRFTVMHDGASHSRPQKIAEIAAWEAGCANLRVCWQGEPRDRNCGNCGKCMRTVLGFQANRLPVPTCFPRSVDAEMLRNVRFLPEEAPYWRHVLEAAVQNKVQDPWVSILASQLRRGRLRGSAKGLLGALRRVCLGAVRGKAAGTSSRR